MATLREEVLALVQTTPGLTDREITDRVIGRGLPQQPVNQVARSDEADTSASTSVWILKFLADRETKFGRPLEIFSDEENERLCTRS